MAKTIQDEFLYKKVYEFSYATSRIASASKNKDIVELLESKAVHLLDSVLVADYEKTRDLVNSIISLASLMVDSGLLNSVNREVLIREAESISLAIQALPKEKEVKEVLPDLNLGKVFSKSPMPIKRQVADKQAKPAVQSEMVRNQSATRLAEGQIAGNGSTSFTAGNVADEIADKTTEEVSPFKSEVRQSAIIAKLQQKENCRLNELQELFPNISERTLRYDLESLISDGFIQRIGSRRNSVYQLTRPSSPAVQAAEGQETSNPSIIELPSHSVNNQGF